MKTNLFLSRLGPFAPIIICLLSACDPLPELRQIDLGDVRPPTMIGQRIDDSGIIELDFDENVSLIPDSLHLAIGPEAGSTQENRIEGGIRELAPPDQVGDDTTPKAKYHRLQLAVGEKLQIGREYAVEAAVRDAAGNSLSLDIPFIGPNPQPPTLLLNEIQVKVSSKNRDALELYVKEAGNLGGVTVFLGVPMDYDACYTFPSVNVAKGEYVVLHCKPEGKGGEVDETNGLNAAAGANCLPSARDFWWRDAPGLPDETAILTLAHNPLGTIKDAVFYTTKKTVAGKDYRGFGTKKLLDRAETLFREGVWRGAGEQIVLEDGCRADGVTSTRTLCRDSKSTDNDEAADWHVVPSKGASVGTVNSDERHVPAK